MCLGIPGQVVKIDGASALVDFWGTRKNVLLSTLDERVVPGDYILDHAGFAVRRIPADQVHDTLMQYEAIFAEAGEDPIIKDVLCELETITDLDLALVPHGTPMARPSPALPIDAHPIVLWELNGTSSRNELSTYESYKTVDQIAVLRPREFVISGADPLRRKDVYQIIDYARRRGLDPALLVSETKELTAETIERLQRTGLTKLIFGLDGSSAAVHERVHFRPPSFAATTRAIREAKATGIRVDINTVVSTANLHDLGAIATLIEEMSISRWNLQFLVPTGDSRQLEMLTSDEAESVFHSIREISARVSFAIRTVEAPHYRRFLIDSNLSHRLPSAGRSSDWADFEGLEVENDSDVLAAAVEGAGSFVFISHAGDVRPSEFLPLSAGNVRYRPLTSVYRNSDLFVALRDPSNLKGRCGHCEFHHVCRGSRARAFAMSGDLFGDDPLCTY
jgi:hydrogenase assembly chaperone HypC/HupF